MAVEEQRGRGAGVAASGKEELCHEVRTMQCSMCVLQQSIAVLSRDKDGDGKLSLQEFTVWLIPDNYDPFNIEAQHLIHHADSDKV